MAFVPPSSLIPAVVTVTFASPQPVTVASLPLPAGAATETTLELVQRAVDDTAAQLTLAEVIA